MLFDTDIIGSAESAARTNAAEVVRVSDQERKSDLGVASAAREVDGRERVPDRPAALTVEAWLDWATKYTQQSIEDGHRDAQIAARDFLRNYFRINNG